MASEATMSPAPAAFDPVRYTRQASRAFNRGRTRSRDAFVDVYTAVLAIGVAQMHIELLSSPSANGADTSHPG